MNKYRLVALLIAGIVIIMGCKYSSRENPYTNKFNLQPSYLAMLDTPNYTKIQYEDILYDFGKIKSGDSVKHEFVFTNTGEKPLFINNIQTNCGCTVPEYTKEPVFKGEKGKIIVSYHSSGQMGNIQKMITVESNTSNHAKHILYVQGEVVN